MLSSISLPSSLYAAGNFSGTSVTPPSCRVKSKPIVITSSATATAEARSTWTEQQRPSYLNMNSSSHSSPASLYQILGISAGASNQEIKAAYRRLARVCHPDVAAIDRKNSSADDFMKIHSAYSTLSDPDKRANYDRSLFRQQLRPLSTMVSSGYSSRKWETDQCW
ncbi:putative DnaJ domain-containing protein [Medicago truncatula]|uniref:Chaperone protein DnaJ 11 n=1 Tax=Medicago truncatula TaxID=3880 RepID=G7JW86_MEDTR|nr:chaperone protein dnaJ 11, chloroplastic [Medicago truncatula]AES95134.1 chaperone protein DnaJ 11 [Medicago truncatula]RHN54327.1 putative DnaJ domain-containing protein [Medicago truncatula]